MGPSLGEVIDQADDWPEVYVCWSLCSLAIAGALVMYGRIVSAHIGTPSNSVRNLIIGIVTLIPVYGLSAWLTLFLPRFYLFGAVLRESFEALVLFWFWKLLIHLMENRFDMSSPSKFWAVPPLCCCCLCCEPQPFTTWHLKLFHGLVLQFAFLRPVLGTLLLFLALFGQNVKEADWEGWNPWIKLVGFVSLMFAMWGLFVMYRLTKPTIGHRHRTTLKFVAIKLIIIIAFIQRICIGFFERATHVFEDRPFGEEVNIELWNNFLLVCEMPFLAVLMFYAFPYSDSLHGDKEGYYDQNEEEEAKPSLSRSDKDI